VSTTEQSASTPVTIRRRPIPDRLNRAISILTDMNTRSDNLTTDQITNLVTATTLLNLIRDDLTTGDQP
jgi:hypothetical protein